MDAAASLRIARVAGRRGFKLHGGRSLFFSDFKDRKEGFLRNIHFADTLHALLAFFLLVEQLALTADIAAVALGDNVFADSSDGGAGNDL